ncbi:MAG: VCBS repeat-containing protein [Myxococcales bacterium]|nr:VCBS repeat-containing protein [Myxococcales bacterium]
MSRPGTPAALAAFALAVQPVLAATSFTEVAATARVDTGGEKFGGLAWGDFNADGCPDLAVNTADILLDGGVSGKLYLSDCSGGAPLFTEVTATNAPHFLSSWAERSVVCGDLDNDGDLDLARNTTSRIEVYLSSGPAGSPPFRLGLQGSPSLVIGADGGFNTEGLGLMDFDADGWLDLVVQNSGATAVPRAIEVFRNLGGSWLGFQQANPPSSPLGLPLTDRGGDFLAVADYDADGDVDIFVRYSGGAGAPAQLWTNQGGTFTANNSFYGYSLNENKGGVAFCDFDEDGDFDVFYSDYSTQRPNEIWIQDQGGAFAPSGEPGGIATDTVEGVACGDVDNDGDLDLFLAGTVNDLLFLNDDPASLGLRLNNLGITGAGRGTAAVLVDYDRDGDLDVSINQSGGNELWRNETDDKNYLMVRALRTSGAATARDELGATMHLEDCDGVRRSGEREVSGGSGRGSQAPALVHFGLPMGPWRPYVVRVKFVGGIVIRRAVVPARLGPYQMVAVDRAGPDELSACDGGYLLPEGDGGAGPRIRWSPKTAATCAVPYRAGEPPVVSGEGPFSFRVAARDGRTLPAELSADPASGEIRWTPSREEVGVHPLELIVIGRQGYAVHPFDVEVSCPPERGFGVQCGCATGEAGGALLVLVWLSMGVGLLPARWPSRARRLGPPRGGST